MKIVSTVILAASAAVLLSCSAELSPEPVTGSVPGTLSFAVTPEEYPAGDGVARSAPGSGARTETAMYDRLEFAVAEPDGDILENLKGFYDKGTSTINIEGLQAGNYRLLVLGIKGDPAADDAEISDIGHASERWLSFPEKMDRPLSAEYFHSSTPFSVRNTSTPEGNVPVADISGKIVQKRIVGRLDVGFSFSSPYIEASAVSEDLTLESPRFYTGISGEGSYSGKSSADRIVLDVLSGNSFIFMPVTADGSFGGDCEVVTRDYRGGRTRRVYTFSGVEISPNTVCGVQIDAVHPEDRNGIMFVTEKHYGRGGHARILQDDEPHTVYTDFSMRSFNTAAPLQVSVEGDSLHVRFYSPKDLEDVLIRAVLPGSDGEYVDLAYFDRIPAFADFRETLPVTLDSFIFRSESGRLVEIPRTSGKDLGNISFETVSGDPYWQKLRAIKHGWNIRFSLYGGDPTREDGGPAGNWMGIRPVHCREAVAFFLNFTYMIDMPEHERILMENQDRLYGNGGITDKVTPETVLSQMRQTRTINAGLVYTGNYVYGLGGGNVFGAYQGGWFGHYTSTYACEVMFHELGHVMGYSHDSAFTYGPWAQELMNNFYVQHLDEMPVESPKYLDSRNNPFIYATEPKSADRESINQPEGVKDN